jgi:hypothetical protein
MQCRPSLQQQMMPVMRSSSSGRLVYLQPKNAILRKLYTNYCSCLCIYKHTHCRKMTICQTKWKTLLSCRFIGGLGGTGTCATSATVWLVYSQSSKAYVQDPSMQVACAEGMDLHSSCLYKLYLSQLQYRRFSCK